jgi:hypothetical protein
MTIEQRKSREKFIWNELWAFGEQNKDWDDNIDIEFVLPSQVAEKVKAFIPIK